MKRKEAGEHQHAQVTQPPGLGGRSKRTQKRKVGTSRIASSGNLPIYKPEGIDISTFKGVKVLHVNGFIKYFRGHVSATAKET